MNYCPVISSILHAGSPFWYPAFPVCTRRISPEQFDHKTKRRLIMLSIIKRPFRLSLCQLFSRQHFIALLIFLYRLIHNILRQGPVIVRIGLQPVTCKLLIKGRLSMAWFISLFRPETESCPVSASHLQV